MKYAKTLVVGGCITLAVIGLVVGFFALEIYAIKNGGLTWVPFIMIVIAWFLWCSYFVGRAILKN